MLTATTDRIKLCNSSVSNVYIYFIYICTYIFHIYTYISYMHIYFIYIHIYFIYIQIYFIYIHIYEIYICTYIYEFVMKPWRMLPMGEKLSLNLSCSFKVLDCQTTLYLLQVDSIVSEYFC
jgi:hypothetical protein